MAEYTQTHVVPTEGLPAWAGPDGSTPPAANLDPGLDVMLLERRGEWAFIRCSNGWEAWVDGRRLVESAPAPAPTASAPPPPAPAAATQAAPPPTEPVPQPPPPPPTEPVPQATAPSQPAPPPPTEPVPQAKAPAQPGPPSAVWGTPGAVAGARRTGRRFRVGPGQIVALAGGFVFFVSSWLEWLHVSVSFGQRSASLSYSSYKIPAHFLLDSQSNQGGLNLGILIAFLGVACIAGALLSGLRRPLAILPIAAGGVSLVVMILFFVQTGFAIDALPSAFEKGYFSVLRYGAIIAMLAAIATLVGGILALIQKRS